MHCYKARLGRDSSALVTGDCGVYGGGPGVDAACQGLHALKVLLAEPHSDGEGTRAMVAEDDDVLVGIEFGVGSRRDFSQGHEERIGKAGGLELPRLAYVEEERSIGLSTKLEEVLGGDFWIEHGYKDIAAH